MHKIEIAALKLDTAIHRLIPNKAKRASASGIVTAGGSGSRMGLEEPKQFLEICDRPCMAYSLLAFQQCPEIDEIVVVCRAGDEDRVSRLCREYGISKLTGVVSGGKTRQDSVRQGFGAISPKSDFVAIHDAARPLLLPQHITLLLKEARRYGASSAANPVSDTLKRSDGREKILETVPRDDLFAVQTPQVFKTDVYRVALALNEKEGAFYTDDCALVEHAGFPIKLCQLSSPNFKMTTPEDLVTIRAILKERNHG